MIMTGNCILFNSSCTFISASLAENFKNVDHLRGGTMKTGLLGFQPESEVITLLFMLSSAETKIYPAHKC